MRKSKTLFLYTFDTFGGVKRCTLLLRSLAIKHHPMKLKTTKNSTRLQNAKSPKAFSGVMFLNSEDDVSCNRSEAEVGMMW